MWIIRLFRGGPFTLFLAGLVLSGCVTTPSKSKQVEAANAATARYASTKTPDISHEPKAEKKAKPKKEPVKKKAKPKIENVKKKAKPKKTKHKKSSKKPRKKMYGAISYSPKTKKWRLRWNVANRQRAIGLVLTECGEPDCRVILVFGPRVCGNFSLGSNDAIGVGSGRTRDEATQAALAGCLAVGSNCKTAKPRCNR